MEATERNGELSQARASWPLIPLSHSLSLLMSWSLQVAELLCGVGLVGGWAGAGKRGGGFFFCWWWLLGPTAKARARASATAGQPTSHPLTHSFTHPTQPSGPRFVFCLWPCDLADGSIDVVASRHHMT